jgi:hypothetical protein
MSFLQLRYEHLGLLAFAILWVNTLLVVGAAFWPLRQLLGWLKRFRSEGLIEATVLIEAAALGDGAIAEHRIEQVGRRASDDADRQAILFHDRSLHGTVLGGRVRTLDGDELELASVEGDAAEIWVARSAQNERAACPSETAFDEAYRPACRAKGFVRQVVTPIAAGERVWIAAQRDGGQLVGSPQAPMLVATVNPRSYCRSRVLLVFLFMMATLALAAGVSWLALYPPVFGTVSTIGGAVGLVYFLLVQPAGVMLRDAVLPPSRLFLRGSWVKSGSEGKGAPAGDALYS